VLAALADEEEVELDSTLCDEAVEELLEEELEGSPGGSLWTRASAGNASELFVSEVSASDSIFDQALSQRRGAND
jgi:hypothetical protein